jgi:hypothetical protein
MNLYTIIIHDIHTGQRRQYGVDLTNKRLAIFIANRLKKPGVYCEVWKSSPGVSPHCIHQTGTGS